MCYVISTKNNRQRKWNNNCSNIFIKKHIIAKYTGCTIIFKKPIKLIGFFYHKHNRNKEIKKPVLCWKKIGSFIYVLFRGSILYAGTLLFDAYALIPWFHFWRGYALITATLLFDRREYPGHKQSAGPDDGSYKTQLPSYCFHVFPGHALLQ